MKLTYYIWASSRRDAIREFQRGFGYTSRELVKIQVHNPSDKLYKIEIEVSKWNG